MPTVSYFSRSNSSTLLLLFSSFALVANAAVAAAAAAPTALSIGAGAGAGGGGGRDCHGKVCQAVQEFCSAFSESCSPCASICEPTSHNFQETMCAKECAEFKKYDPLQENMNHIQTQLKHLTILVIVLISLVAIRYAYKCVRWLRHKRYFTVILKKLQPKKKQQQQHQQQQQQQQQAQAQAHNGQKDIGGTTISNPMAIHDLERAPSQIYSVAGAADGSVMTMTTPVSTRYPAENFTETPTSVPTEYSYDNQALSVTPVSEKPTVVRQGF